MAAKIKGLQQWCQKMAEGYPGVNISNFTTAWRDGLAFCAIIHRFRPDLIDFDSLSPDNVFENCKFAFEVAERELKIPAFLEAEDMARLKVPDKLSIITYVSQYYNYLHSLPQLGGPGVKSKVPNKVVSGTKRPTDSNVSQAPSIKKASVADNKENLTSDKGREEVRGDMCVICQNRVYLLERYMESGKLYHRSCFRHSELSPANKVCARSPFLSPSLSTETAGFKNSGSAKGATGMNCSQETGNKVKAAGVISQSIAKRADGAGLKHSLDVSEREDVKKSKIQPRALFSDQKSKTESLNVNSSEMTPTKTKINGSALPLSSMEAEKLVRRQDVILASEKSEDKTHKSAKQNIPLIFQQNKTTSDSPKTVSTVPTPKTTSETTPATGASNTEVSGNVINSKFSEFKINNTITSDTSSISKVTSGNVHNKDAKEAKNTSKEMDIASSRTPASSDAQDQRKLFLSGKSNMDSGEPADMPRPVARPRSATLRSMDEESNKGISVTTSAELRNKDKTPKPAPRKSATDITEAGPAAQQPIIFPQNEKITPSINVSQDHLGTSESTSGFPPPLPKSAPPPLPSPSPRGVAKTAEQDFVRPSVLMNGDKTKMKDNEKINNKSHPTISIVKEQNNVSHTKVETKDLHKLSETSSSNKQTSKNSEGQVFSGLLTSLAGVRAQTSTVPGSSSAKISVLSSGSTAQANTNSSLAFKTSVNITMPSHAGSLADASSYPKYPPSNAQSQISAEKKAVTQQHKDLISSIKVNSNTPISQTPNKVQEQHHVVNPPKSHVAATAPSVTISSVKHTIPEKLNSQSSVTNSSKNVIAFTKDSPATLLNVNQNSGAKFATGTNTSKKLADTENRSDSKQASHPGIASQKSHDESKNFPISKTKGAPVSEESISIRLKRVMPEQKEVDKEPRTSIYDVKLKKVVIKGDVRWESVSQENTISDTVPQKPMSSASGKAKPDNTLSNHAESVGKKNSQLHVQPFSEGKLQKTSAVSPSVSHSSNDLPQWKKDIEERKKKLKDDVTKSESETDQFKYHQGKDTRKTEVSVDKVNITAKREISYTTQDIVDGLGSGLQKPQSSADESRESQRKLSHMRGNQEKTPKLDWQLEAEKRMAAFANFDFDEIEKSKDTGKSGTVGSKLQENALSHEIQKHKSDDLSEITDRTDGCLGKLNDGVLIGDQINVKKMHSVGVKTVEKSKDSEFKLTVTTAQGAEKKLTLEKKSEAVSGDHSSNRVINNDRGDDFRDVLHHLKHVTTPEDGNVDNRIDEKSESISDNSTDKNNSNTSSEQGQVTDAEHIKKLNKKGGILEKAIKEDKTDENGNKRKNNIFVSTMKKLVSEKAKGTSDKDVEKPSSPKVKRKITVLGKSKKESVAPTTPTSMRKIPVTAKFNFEESTDFENSILEPTAKMTIQEKHSLPHSNNNTLSPNNISAIEIQQQLLEIDSRLTGLEIRGRELEDSIRKVNALEDDDDQLMIEWFSLVSEKNDLVRKEADLVYLSREQDLEGEQEQIESQLRYLMSKSDASKSPEEAQEEDYLIKRKVKLVEERNLIVDSMDEDRIRYEAEDRSIEGILRDKGYWKDSTGTLKALRGKKVAKSVFYT